MTIRCAELGIPAVIGVGEKNYAECSWYKRMMYRVGLSGSGKTTTGRKLETYFNEIGKKCYLLDGDEIWDLFDRDLGYPDADCEVR